MPEIKPLIINPSTSDPSSARSDFKSKVGSSPIKKTYTKKGSTLAQGAADWKKLLLYAHTGAGKTYAIGQLALAGYRCLGISTDFGGNGLASASALIADNDVSKLNNIYNVDLTDYDEVMAFLEEPKTFFPDIYEYNPDFLYWEGFSAYQLTILSDRVLDEKDTGSALKADMQDWGKIKSGTVRPLNRFLNLHDTVTGKHWNKIVTCHKDLPKEDKLTGQRMSGPLIQGAAFSIVQMAFDAVIAINVVNKKDGDNASKREYSYLVYGNDNIAAKARGLKLESVEPADMAVVWKKIETQMKNLSIVSTVAPL